MSAPQLSTAQRDALELFLDDGRVPVDELDPRTRASLVRHGLIRATTLNGENLFVLTPEGRKAAEENGYGETEAESEVEETDEVEWLDELPGKGYGRQVTEPAFLRAHPGKWSEIHRGKTKGGAHSRQSSLRRAFKDLGYEFAGRTVGGEYVVYGRWQGKP